MEIVHFSTFSRLKMHFESVSIKALHYLLKPRLARQIVENLFLWTCAAPKSFLMIVFIVAMNSVGFVEKIGMDILGITRM